MAKFKALLWREWRLSRRQTLGACFACLGLMILYWLVGLSMQFGNLKAAMEDNADAAFILTYFSGLAPVYLLGAFFVFSICGVPGTHPSDIKAGWLRYSFGLPISPKLRAAVTWGMTVLRTVICFAMNLLNLCAAHLLFDDVPFQAESLLVFLMFSVFGLLLNLATAVYPLSARTESECTKRSAVSMICFIVLILIAVMPLARRNTQKVQELIGGQEESDTAETDRMNEVFRYLFQEPLEKAYNTCKYPAIPAYFILTAAGWQLSALAYKRRETE